MQSNAMRSVLQFQHLTSLSSTVRGLPELTITATRSFANNKTSTGPHGGSGSSPNTSKDNPPPQSPPQQSMEVSPEVPQHEAADKIPSQVPNQLDGKRFPDPLEADTTVTNAPDKALPKDKAQ